MYGLTGVLMVDVHRNDLANYPDAAVCVDASIFDLIHLKTIYVHDAYAHVRFDRESIFAYGGTYIKDSPCLSMFLFMSAMI